MQDANTVIAADKPRGGPQREGEKAAGLKTSVWVKSSFQLEENQINGNQVEWLFTDRLQPLSAQTRAAGGTSGLLSTFPAATPGWSQEISDRSHSMHNTILFKMVVPGNTQTTI